MEENFETTVGSLTAAPCCPDLGMAGVWNLLDGLRTAAAQLEAAIAWGDIDALAQHLAHREQLLTQWVRATQDYDTPAQQREEVVQHLEELVATDERLRAALLAWREAVRSRIRELDQGGRLLKEYGGVGSSPPLLLDARG